MNEAYVLIRGRQCPIKDLSMMLIETILQQSRPRLPTPTKRMRSKHEVRHECEKETPSRNTMNDSRFRRRREYKFFLYYVEWVRSSSHTIFSHSFELFTSNLPSANTSLICTLLHLSRSLIEGTSFSTISHSLEQLECVVGHHFFLSFWDPLSLPLIFRGSLPFSRRVII